jgi:hypothetical protein
VDFATAFSAMSIRFRCTIQLHTIHPLEIFHHTEATEGSPMDDCDDNAQVFPISACCCILFQPCVVYGSKYNAVFDSEIYRVIMTISIPTEISAVYLREI